MRISKNRRGRISAKNDANHFIELTVHVYVHIHFTEAIYVLYITLYYIKLLYYISSILHTFPGSVLRCMSSYSAQLWRVFSRILASIRWTHPNTRSPLKTRETRKSKKTRGARALRAPTLNLPIEPFSIEERKKNFL